MMNNIIFCLSAFFASSAAQAASDAYYVVEEGDTFSEIVQKKVGSPILGRHGAINRVLQLNPEIKNIHKIFPAQEIRLPESLAAEKPPAAPARALASLEDGPAEPGVGHRLNLSAGYDFTNLSSVDKQTGSEASLYSKYSFRLGAGWEQAWTESFSTFANLELRKLDFEPSTNASKSLARTNKFMASLDAGVKRKFGSRFTLAGAVGFGSELFPRARSASVVEIDSVSLPHVDLGLNFRLFEKGATSVSALAGASYLFSAKPDGYSISGGTRLRAGIRLEHEGKANLTSLDLGFAQRRQDTSLVDLTDRAFFGRVLFSVPLFKSDKP